MEEYWKALGYKVLKRKRSQGSGKIILVELYRNPPEWATYWTPNNEVNRYAGNYFYELETALVDYEGRQ